MLPSPATKTAAISDYLAGKGGYFKIANEYGISPFTLKKWVESPEKALNQSSQTCLRVVIRCAEVLNLLFFFIF